MSLYIFVIMHFRRQECYIQIDQLTRWDLVNSHTTPHLLHNHYNSHK